MGLQIRLAHSLGQRMIELQPRGADQPIVVGRAPNAEVQVPSTNVGKQHCLLFVHEGRWVVQDGGSQHGTFLNGEQIVDPAYLNSGDVISLGGGVNPSTITIDPFGLGSISVGDPEATGVAAPAFQHAPPAAYGGYETPAPGGLPQPGRATGGIVDDEADDNIFAPAGAAPAFAGETAAEEGTGWEGVRQERRYYIPKKQTMSPGVIAGIVGGAALILVVVFVAVRNTQEKNKEERAKPKQIIVKPDAPRKSGSSIFDFGGGAPPEKRSAVDSPEKTHRTTSVAMAPKVRPVEPPPATTTTAAEDPPKVETQFNPEKQDEKWKAVDEAQFLPDLAIRVSRYQDYLAQVPNSSLKKEVDGMIETTVDMIWWNRISELVGEVEECQAEIKKRKADSALAKDAEFQKGLEAEIAKYQTRMERAQATLKDDMQYAGDKRPNDLTDAQIAALRGQRDKEYYDNKWKPAVLERIRKSHGMELPWKQSR